MSTTTPSTKPEVEPEAQSGDDQEQMERENQETNTGVNVEYSEVKEQDRWLPIANVARIMKTALPENAKIAKEAKECMQECVSEFISFITSEASEKCQQEKRKTVNGEDILFAMTSLGFENYAEALKIYLSKYRELPVLGTVLARLPSTYIIKWAKKRMRLLRLENDQIEANFDSESTLVESIRERGKEDNEPDQFEIAFVAGPAQDGKGDIFSNLPPNLVHQIVHYLDQLDMRSEKTNELAMLNLETGKELILTDKPNFDYMARSGRYVLTSKESHDGRGGVVAAWDIHTSQKAAEKDFGHDAPFQIIVTKDIAVSSSYSEQSRPLFVWNLRSNQDHKIGYFSPDLFHADADESVLITFEIYWCSDLPEVWQIKWSQRETFAPSTHATCRDDRCPNFAEMHTYGHKTVTALPILEQRSVVATLYLLYDHVVDRLSFRWIDRTMPFMSEEFFYRSFDNLAPNINYYWGFNPDGVGVQNAITGTTAVRPYKVNIQQAKICDELALPILIVVL
ncbi:hypothetical protein VTN49DRAFT_4737 [Thermomyces lanuginosus]|uniref:uncharacterized protein n=1 Tax=Thermomyces lanuginosus TaxID=5541 RepID=UPI0037439499